VDNRDCILEGEEPDDDEPNDQQQDLIDSKQGIHVVDAGAGTGKTFTVTRRYAEIVDQDDVEARGRPPRDVHQQRGDGDERANRRQL